MNNTIVATILMVIGSAMVGYNAKNFYAFIGFALTLIASNLVIN